MTTSNIVRETIDELFSVLSNPNISQADKDEANRHINELYTEFQKISRETEYLVEQKRLEKEWLKEWLRQWQEQIHERNLYKEVLF